MDKEIYIVRHGRTAFNKLGIWQGSSVDSPLDEVGEQQSEAFFRRYAKEDFDFVAYSKLQRSRQTIQRFLDLGIDYLETPDINEISWGLHEGKPHTPESLAEYKNVVGQWQKENYRKSFEGGESAEEMGIRISNFVSWIKVQPSNKILVCSHGRAIRCLLTVMKDEPLKEMEKYKHANTGVFKSIYKEGTFKFEKMNDTEHLL